jgi:hypothetical protein
MALRRALQRHSLPFLIGWGLRRSLRLLTGRWRALPDFIIIGGQRCGTTSLYHYLVGHPAVAPAFMKEVHFFDTRYDKGLNWYRAHFPLARERRRSREKGRLPMVSGEATPYYLLHPHAPKRIAASLPEVKLIALLRNPVNRAVSQYHHQVRMGAEPLSFEAAIEKEIREGAGERQKMLVDEAYQSPMFQGYSYLARGVYVEQLQRWHRHFEWERLLILCSEDLYRDPAATVQQVVEFLGLPAWRGGPYPPYNRGVYDDLDEDLRQRLAAHFREPNQRLYDYLGRDFGWDNTV